MVTDVGGVPSSFAVESRGAEIAGELIMISVSRVLSTFAVEDRGAGIVEGREVFSIGD